MALRPDQVSNIVHDAIELREAMIAHGIDDEVAEEWVGSSMLAIVMHEVEEDTSDQYSQTYPTEEQVAAKQAQLRRELDRWGNVDPESPVVIDNDTLRILAIGPAPDQDFRLVAVTPEMTGTWTTAAIMNAAGEWVLDHEPGASLLSADSAGRTPEGNPVYLVTYILPGPAGASDDDPYVWMSQEHKARFGNFDPDHWPSLRGGVTGQLEDGPEPGTGMRLALVQGGAGARQRAMRWVRDNVPDAGKIISTTQAGVHPDDGRPAYLVTYELKDGN
jgi:hypothetical protein